MMEKDILRVLCITAKHTSSLQRQRGTTTEPKQQFIDMHSYLSLFQIMLLING